MADLNDEDMLASDLIYFVDLYRRMAVDPAIPTVEDLAWSEAPSPTVTGVLPVKEFEPQPVVAASFGSASTSFARARLGATNSDLCAFRRCREQQGDR
jgi:hypothetical protein